MNDAKDNAGPPHDSPEGLADYLKDRDQPCPSCGYNLRGGSRGTCPECGLALTAASLAAARGPSTSPPILAVRVLSAIAFCIALYLAINSITNNQPAGCSAGAGCGEVLSSPWSSLWGIPVSLPGVFVYLGLFISTFHVAANKSDSHRRDAWTVMYALAIFAGLAAVWFTYLQLAVIKSICPYCMMDHACGMLIAALVLYSAPINRGEQLKDGKPSPMMLGKKRAIAIAAGSAMIMGMFILSQFAFPAATSKQYVTGSPITPGSTPPTNTDDPAKVKPVAGNGAKDSDITSDSSPAKPTDSIELTLLKETDPYVWLRLPKGPQPDGLVRFQRTGLPVRGNINAKVMLVSMVDYTCPHCRAFHHLMSKAIDRYGSQIAFIIVPMPLNPNCNPYVQHLDEKHAAACDLARLSLAVWKVDPARFAEFDDWLFAPDLARSATDAQAKAEQLVGKEAIAKVFETGWPHEQALKHVRVYDMAAQGRIPKVMFQNLRIEGGIQEDDLWRWLEDTEGMKLQRR